LLKVLVDELIKIDKPNEDTDDDDLTIEERYAFLKKPMAERNLILAAQAELLREHYEQDIEWQEWLAFDNIAY
jgi:hypothetical protein